MPLVQAPLLGSAYTSRTRLLNCQRCVNLYGELVETRDGKEVGAFYGTPGLVQLTGQTATGPWRELYTSGSGHLYGVRADKLVQLTGTFSSRDVGTIQTSTGPVGICDNGKQLLIVDGQNAYGYDIGADDFQVIALPFSVGAPSSCAYQDGFFLINQTGTQQFWQSDLMDVFGWDAANFSTKDGQADPIAALVDSHREVWVIGTATTEVWINAGNPGFAFQRLQGVFIEYGCAAPASARKVGDSVIWVSQNTEGGAIVIQTKGYRPTRISTHAIEREIQSYGNIADATAYVYQQEGHLFYVLNFTAADTTWVFDATTELWHERASWNNGHFHRHRANCAAIFRNGIVVGDFENGSLYQYSLDDYTDAGLKRKWLRSFAAQPTGQINLRNNRYSRFQLYMEPGVASTPPTEVRALDDTDYIRTLDETLYVRVLSGAEHPWTANYTDPQVMLRWSDSGGLSWSNEHWQPVGRIGEVKKRVLWRRLGSSRDRVWELSGTDPYKVALVGAFQEIEQGLS